MAGREHLGESVCSLLSLMEMDDVGIRATLEKCQRRTTVLGRVHRVSLEFEEACEIAADSLGVRS